jgi:hypothetical protein
VQLVFALANQTVFHPEGIADPDVALIVLGADVGQTILVIAII